MFYITFILFQIIPYTLSCFGNNCILWNKRLFCYNQKEFECCLENDWCITNTCIEGTCANPTIARTICNDTHPCPKNYFCNKLWSFNRGLCIPKKPTDSYCLFNEQCFNNYCKWFYSCK